MISSVLRVLVPTWLLLWMLPVAATEIPPELQGEPWRQITAQIESSRHDVRQVDGTWQAHTPAQDYVTEFTEAGPVFRLDDGEVTHEIGLLLDSIDVDGQPVELAAPRIHAKGNTFEYQRGAVTEWYVNNPDGVRQWFRVDEAPAGDMLNVAMRLDSDLSAAMNGDELRLNEGSRTVARFAGLQVWDAQQVPLPASMRVAEGRLIVAVETEGAAYPITIDPVMFSEVAKLLPPDGAAGDEFGFSVSLSGDRVLVAAYLDDDNGSNSGSAYVFDFNGTAWTETAKLLPPDGATSDQFGRSVSLSGDRALVGAIFGDGNASNSGSAYVFDFNGTSWIETAKLTAGDGAASDWFGHSVSLSGDRALVGAVFGDENASDSGSAYVFDFNGTAWSETAKLTASDGAASDQFGFSVSLSGDRALVGARADDDNAGNSGSAYVFDFDGAVWTQTAKITASDGAASDLFGSSVSLSGDRALVGAPVNIFVSNVGSAYMFEFNGTAWSETAKLTASDGAASDQFGSSVSLSGDRALVGAYRDDDSGTDSGSAYVFDFNGTSWSETSKLLPVEGAAGDNFGQSVSLSGDRALVGAYRDDDHGTDSGSAYIFVDNQAPMAQPDAVSTDEDTPLAGDVLADNGSGADSDPDGDPLTVTEVNGVPADVGTQIALASGALLTVNNDGSFDYDPNGLFESLGSGDSAIDTFDYTISDGQATDSATVMITINGVDDPPVAVDDIATVNEDEPATTIDVLANDTDIDGGPIAINSVTQPAGGTAVITGGGSSLTYTPDPEVCNDGMPTDDFSYTLAPGSSTATVAVTVTCINDAPVANAGTANTNEDNAVTITLTGSDVDGDALTFAIATGPANGSLSAIMPINATTAEVTYTPNPDFNGSDSFTFTVNDGALDSAAATVSITINAVDDPPIALDDTATVNEDNPATAIDVLANDTDIDGGPIAINSVTQPTGGTVTITGGASAMTYQPDPNFCNDGSPTDDFSYTLAPGSSTATVAVTVTCINDAPVADAGTATTDEDMAVTITLTGSDIDGDALTFAIATSPAEGSLGGIVPINDTTAEVTYTPDADFNGSDSFTFMVNDGTVDSTEAAISITVDAVNDPPAVNDDTSTTDEDTPVDIDVLANDSDIDGNVDPATVTVTAGPADGATSVNTTTGVITYTPDPDFNGNDAFTYEVCDDGTPTPSECASATVSITIDAVNDPPAVNDDTATTDEDTPVDIDVLANDSDIDGNLDPATVTVTSGPADGATSVNTTTGVITYTPAPDFNGNDAFTYEVCDDGTPTPSECASATVSITIDAVNDPPAVNDDTATTDEDTPDDIDVLANDSDIDGNLDPATVTVTSVPADGATSVNTTTGLITYTPDPDFNGNDAFTYQVCDDGTPTPSECVSAAVSITIDADNDPPEADANTATTDEDVPVTITLTGSDVDGDALTFAIATGPTNGSLSTITPINDTTADVTYTPDPDFNGNDSFTFTVNDGTVDSAAATVDITTDAVNDSPEADAATATTDEDVPVTIMLTGSDVDGDALTFSIATGPANGSLGTVTSINDTSAEVTYTPGTDFNGNDSFTFTVNDGIVDSAAATVDITVDAVNDPPSFVAGGEVTEIEDGNYAEPWADSISAGPADESGQTVSFLVTDNTNTGLFSVAPAIDPAGTLTFTPAPDTTGSATIEVEAMDDGGTANGGDDLSATESFTIDVIAAADLILDKISGAFFTLPGGTVSYTIDVSNPGPSDVTDATVIDIPPARLGNVSWTCTPSGTAVCNNPSGAVEINEQVSLPEGTSVTFELDAELLDMLNEPITNAAEVQTPIGVLELEPANNSDSDTDAVGQFVDSFESVEPD